VDRFAISCERWPRRKLSGFLARKLSEGWEVSFDQVLRASRDGSAAK